MPTDEMNVWAEVGFVQPRGHVGATDPAHMAGAITIGQATAGRLLLMVDRQSDGNYACTLFAGGQPAQAVLARQVREDPPAWEALFDAPALFTEPVMLHIALPTSPAYQVFLRRATAALPVREAPTSQEEE